MSGSSTSGDITIERHHLYIRRTTDEKYPDIVRYHAECSCRFRGLDRLKESDAIESAYLHARTVRKYSRNSNAVDCTVAGEPA